MFQALRPLLAERSLMLTLTSIEDGRIRVTVNPMAKKTASDVKDATVPFIAEGTAEELDAELAEKIGSYTAQHLSLDESLEQARREIEAAKKEAKEAAAKHAAEAKKSAPKGKFVSPAKAPEPKSEPPKAPDLFSTADAPETKATDAAPAPESITGSENSTPSQEVSGNGSESQAYAA